MLHWISYMDSLLNKGLPRTSRHNPPPPPPPPSPKKKKEEKEERESATFQGYYGFMGLMLNWSSYMDSLLNKGLPRTSRHNPHPPPPPPPPPPTKKKRGKRRERKCHFSRVLWTIYCWKAPLNNKVIIEQAGLS